MRKRLLLAIAFLATVGACGDAARAGSGGVTVDTLASGVINVVNTDRGSWDGSRAWRAVETFRVGQVEGGGPAMFGSPLDIEVDPLGRVYVLDVQEMEVRVFDSTGVHVRSFGRKGGGPGEFMQPLGMTWGPREELWIVDPANARYAVFDTAGHFLRAHFRQNPSIKVPWPGIVDSAGRLYDLRDDVRNVAAPVLLRYDRAVQRADTFAVPEVMPLQFTRTNERGKMFNAVPVPFAPRGYWTLAPDGRIWSGFADRYRLELKALDGRTIRVVEKPFEPVPVSEAEVDSAEKTLEGFVREGGTVDMSRVPKTKPAFTSVHVDDRGYLWVEPTIAGRASGPAFDVFDPEGRYLGRLDFPASIPNLFYPVIRGEHLYGFVVDELEVPSVVGFRLEGRRAR